jgi:hypothetical protein
MFLPLVERQLVADPLVGWNARKCKLAPLPPNIEAPPASRSPVCITIWQGPARQGSSSSAISDRSIRQAAERAAWHRRNPRRARRESADRLYRLVHPRHGPGRREVLRPRRGTRHPDPVIVSGYAVSDYEAFGLFSEVDAFCHLLDEGLTARRSNILACVQSARPVIVTAPAKDDEFDHQPRFSIVIEHGATTLVARR